MTGPTPEKRGTNFDNFKGRAPNAKGPGSKSGADNYMGSKSRGAWCYACNTDHDFNECPKEPPHKRNCSWCSQKRKDQR